MAIYLPQKNTGEWINFTGFLNDFSSYSPFTGMVPAGYKKIGDLVFFRGVIFKPTSSNSETVLILPETIRPNRNYYFSYEYENATFNSGRSSAGFNGVIFADGSLDVFSSNAVDRYIYLDSINCAL